MNALELEPRAPIAAVLAVFATYVYFLLFAEFAFLERVRQVAPGFAQQRLAMLALGLGGVAGALGAAALFRPQRAVRMLAWMLRASAASALLSLLAPNLATLALAAVLSGAALGALTVTLAATLRGTLGRNHLGLGIGAGTGLAYALCNIPSVFHASPTTQTWLASAAVTAASGVVRWMALPPGRPPGQSSRGVGSTARWILVLLPLVWLDSAAFYIIQHTPALRAATWERPSTLWVNAGLHLAAALLSGWCLDRGRLRGIITLASLALGLAVLSLDGALPSWVGPNLLYVAGVSLYSVALVDIPARSGAPWAAAGIFAIAGWAGSALGIGMAQDLARVPPAFVAIAFAVVVISFAPRRRPHAALALCLAALIGGSRADEVRAGREVYIAEGCLHCHSQYVREQVPLDVLNWGPATPLSESLAGAPPLFGTRRQGPDLARVGNRRSIEWNRLHLLSPQAISPGSRMPSYAHLFAQGDNRGEALLAYLASLGADTMAERQKQIASWTPADRAALAATESAKLFQRLCAPCHGETGNGRGPLVAKLSVRPPNWATDAWRHVPPGADAETRLAQIIKFGLPGLPMAGHEYLSDPEVVGLARHVRALYECRITHGPDAPP
jgi:cytochrome c553